MVNCENKIRDREPNKRVKRGELLSESELSLARGVKKC